MSAALDLAALVSIIKDVYHSRLLNGCALTLAIYDWLLVFPDEYETILQSGWSLPKFLYYFIRVITPFGLFLNAWEMSDVHGPLSDRFCTFWGFSTTFAFLLGMCAGNALLALRLTALYRQNRWAVRFIRGFFVASYTVVVGLIIDGLITFHDNFYYSQFVKACATVKLSKTFPAVFYSPVAFEFFLFSLTLRCSWHDAQILVGTGSSPLLLVLYRDGFVCFFVMLGIRIWTIWLCATHPISSYGLGTNMLWATHAVLITRVYMNLVWSARGPRIAGTGMSTNDLTGTSIRMHAPKSTESGTHDWPPNETLTINVDGEEARSQTIP